MSIRLETETSDRGMTIRRHRLENGLRVITLVDRQAPIVSYQTWFGVGSKHENKGATGVAHFFEHLMFTQTETTPTGEFDRIIEATGGDNNAATWVDWTYYRTTVPSSALDMTARLESDRLQHLVLSPDIVEAEREVVINERLLRVEDDPDGFLEEELFRLAFTDHPYHWPTIGWMDDIRRIRIDQLKAFYRTHYGPQNAALVIVGDIDVEHTLDTIENHYGSIPAGDPLPRNLPSEPEQNEERVAHYQQPISSARLLWGYHIPGQTHEDWVALSLVGSLLSCGPSSRLYRRLVADDEVAATVDCSPMPFADPSLFRVSAQAMPGIAPERIGAIIDEEVATLCAHGATDRELEKLVSAAEVEFWLELETCDGKAEALGHYELTWGDYRHLFSHAEAIPRVTKDSLQRVTRRYLRPENRTAIACIPEEEVSR